MSWLGEKEREVVHSLFLFYFDSPYSIQNFKAAEKYNIRNA